jgi:hypothetical protein
MIRNLWRGVKGLTYRRGMSQRRQFHVEPIRRPVGLDSYAGMWVAVKDGVVVAAAYNSRDLVPMVREKGRDGEGAVAQFVPTPSEDIVIGVG